MSNPEVSLSSASRHSRMIAENQKVVALYTDDARAETGGVLPPAFKWRKALGVGPHLCSLAQVCAGTKPEQ
jgi:hypothetical protein